MATGSGTLASWDKKRSRACTSAAVLILSRQDLNGKERLSEEGSLEVIVYLVARCSIEQ